MAKALACPCCKSFKGIFIVSQYDSAQVGADVGRVVGTTGEFAMLGHTVGAGGAAGSAIGRKIGDKINIKGFEFSCPHCAINYTHHNYEDKLREYRKNKLKKMAQGAFNTVREIIIFLIVVALFVFLHCSDDGNRGTLLYEMMRGHLRW